MSEITIDQVVNEVLETLSAAHARQQRGLVAIRCTGPREVDHARETLLRAAAPFVWKSLPAAELDPPDLIGYVLHAGEAKGPCFLAYGLPKNRAGNVMNRFVELITVAGRKYVMSPYLMVLILTIDEIKDLSRGAPHFWRSRDRYVGWPVQDAASRFVPAPVSNMPAARGGRVAVSGAALSAMQAGLERAHGINQAGGGVEGTHYDVSSEDYGLTPWVGAPFRVGDEIPPYIANAAAPAGRRWGQQLARDDEEGARLIDQCRQLLDQRATEWARQGLAKAAKRFRGMNNGPATAECYVLLGRASELRFDHTVALEWYEQALGVYEQIEDEAGVSDALNMIGYLRFMHGDLDGAFSFFDKAMRRDEECGDELRLSSGYRRIGIILEERSELKEALLLYERAGEIEQRNNDRFAYSRSLHHQSRLHARKENYELARELLEQSLTIKEELMDESGMATGYHELGNLELRERQLDLAQQSYERALELEEKLGDVQGIAVTQAQMGLVRRELFAFSEAVLALTIARELFHRLQSPYVAAMDGTLEALRDMCDKSAFDRAQVEARQYVGDLLVET